MVGVVAANEGQEKTAEKRRRQTRKKKTEKKEKRWQKNVTHTRSSLAVIDIAPVVLASWTKQRKGVRVELGSFRVDSRRGMGSLYQEG